MPRRLERLADGTKAVFQVEYSLNWNALRRAAEVFNDPLSGKLHCFAGNADE